MLPHFHQNRPRDLNSAISQNTVERIYKNINIYEAYQNYLNITLRIIMLLNTLKRNTIRASKLEIFVTNKAFIPFFFPSFFGVNNVSFLLNCNLDDCQSNSSSKNLLEFLFLKWKLIIPDTNSWAHPLFVTMALVKRPDVAVFENCVFSLSIKAIVIVWNNFNY